MEHRFDIAAKCPKKCGAERIFLFAWCFGTCCELRCPKCDASKTVSNRWGNVLIDRELSQVRGTK